MFFTAKTSLEEQEDMFANQDYNIGSCGDDSGQIWL